jgi:hypothetical protein
MSDAKVTGGLFEGKRGKPLRVTGDAENLIQKAITEFLEMRKVVYAVTNARTVQTTDGPRQLVYPEGWPDITAIFPITGQLWAIEVKTDKGELRESQVDMLALIEASGGRVTVARDCLEIRQILNEHLAQYQTSLLIPYFQVIESLKRIYLQHATARAMAAKVAKAIKRFKRGGRLNRTVEKAQTINLFPPKS